MSVQPPTLQALARPSGTFAMVVMDQRESLRALLHEATQDVVGDAALADFKLAVARHLSSYASGFLIDRMRPAGEVDVLVLAQASMATVLAMLPPDRITIPVLSSPRTAVRQLKPVLNNTMRTGPEEKQSRRSRATAENSAVGVWSPRVPLLE